MSTIKLSYIFRLWWMHQVIKSVYELTIHFVVIVKDDLLLSSCTCLCNNYNSLK